MAKIQNKVSELKIVEGLYKDVSLLIEQSRKRVALVVNQEMTLLYWRIGRAISTHCSKIKEQSTARILL